MSTIREDLLNVAPSVDSESTDAEVGAPTPGEVQVQTPSHTPAADSSAAAARLLEIAARNADQLLSEAQAEAETTRASARDEADQLVTEARAEAERIRAELEQSRSQANDEIARLRETEQEHRATMRQHLREMLAKVEPTS
jgi:cell division septum initiation protein DivIVA